MKKRISVLLCMLLFLGVLSGCGQSGEKRAVFGESHLKQAALYPAGAEEPSAVITDPETLEQIETWMGTRLGPNSFTCVSRAADRESLDAYRRSSTVIILTLDTLSTTFVASDWYFHMGENRGYDQVLIGEQILLINAGGGENEFEKSSCWPEVDGLQNLYRDLRGLFSEP